MPCGTGRPCLAIPDPDSTPERTPQNCPVHLRQNCPLRTETWHRPVRSQARHAVRGANRRYSAALLPWQTIGVRAEHLSGAAHLRPDAAGPERDTNAETSAGRRLPASTSASGMPVDRGSAARLDRHMTSKQPAMLPTDRCSDDNYRSRRSNAAHPVTRRTRARPATRRTRTPARDTADTDASSRERGGGRRRGRRTKRPDQG
jgi:hypothetical protein